MFPRRILRNIVVILIFSLIFVPTVTAISLTFQDPDDFSEQIGVDDYYYSAYYWSDGTTSWVQNTSGGNSVIKSEGSTWCGGDPYAYVRNSYAYPMTYAAATWVTTSTAWGQNVGFRVKFYDSSGAAMGSVVSVEYNASYPLPNRIEVVMSGGTAYVYQDGVLRGNSGAMTQNPSYIGFGHSPKYNSCTGSGTVTIDDIVWGASESKYIFGMPEENLYFLMKDILNPAVSGFYKVNTTDPTGDPVVMSAFTMPSTFGKHTGDNETLVMNEYGGGNYAIKYTGTKYANEIQWNIQDFFNSTAPYGLYITTIPGISPVEYSDTIMYIGSGATIQFDGDHYGNGETATLSVSMTDAYYDTGTYSYSVRIQDIFGNEVYDEPIVISPGVSHTGTAEYTWETDDTTGVYYGMIIANRISDGEELIMNFDVCELSAYFNIEGFVKDAPTAAALSGATVNVSQLGVYESDTSGSDGNYSTSQFLIVGSPITIAAWKSGYRNYTHTFTPGRAASLSINLSLVPDDPTHTGIAVCGVARTPPYNRTIDSADVVLMNTSGYYYTVATNSAGYYIQNEMPNAVLFDIWGNKTGFENSSVYQLLTVGS